MEDYLMSVEEFNKLKGGDWVTIRPDLAREMILPYGVNEEMENVRGETTRVVEKGFNVVWLRNSSWKWCNEMLLSNKKISSIRKKLEDRAYTDFKNGDLVKIRSYDELKNNYGDILGFVLTKVCFSEEMKKFCGKKAVIKAIDTEGIARIKIKGLKREEYRKYEFCTDMFEIVEEDYESKRKEKEVKKVKIANQDIEKEMIKKVDVAKIKKILASAFRIKATDLKGIIPMLKDWAKQKKDLYVLLGNQLKVTKEIEYEADNNVWEENREQLARKFPRYTVFALRYTTKSI